METMVLEVAGNVLKVQPVVEGDFHSWNNMHDHLEAAKITMGKIRRDYVS